MVDLQVDTFRDSAVLSKTFHNGEICCLLTVFDYCRRWELTDADLVYSREKWEYDLPSPVTQNFINFFCCGDTLQEQYHTVKTTNVEDTDEGMLYAIIL